MSWPAWASSFHPFYFYAAAIWLVLVALRSVWWRYRPTAKCNRCGAAGKVRNRLRGTWLRELIWFGLFVPPGFFFFLFMDVYLSYFLMRWFVIRECSVCESESLDYSKPARVNEMP